MISRQADCRFLSYFSKIMLVQYCAKLNFVLAIFWQYLLEILSWMIMMPLHVKQNISDVFTNAKIETDLARLCS